jgi:hypothetical protein
MMTSATKDAALRMMFQSLKRARTVSSFHLSSGSQ